MDEELKQSVIKICSYLIEKNISFEFCSSRYIIFITDNINSILYNDLYENLEYKINTKENKFILKIEYQSGLSIVWD